jgi:hypothetical protein
MLLLCFTFALVTSGILLTFSFVLLKLVTAYQALSKDALDRLQARNVDEYRSLSLGRDLQVQDDTKPEQVTAPQALRTSDGRVLIPVEMG